MKSVRNRLVLWMAGVVLGLMAAAVQAGPGQGIRSGPWMVSPYVDLAGTYSTDIIQGPTATEDDYYLDSEIGLKAAYSAYMIDFSGLGFLAARNYADHSENNFGAGGDVITLKYGLREQLQFQLDQSYRHVEDLDKHGGEVAVGGISPDSVLDVSSRNERDINQVGLSAGKNVTDKAELDLGYRYDAISYDTASLADLSSHAGQFEAAYGVTDKSAALVTLVGGVQENSVMDDSADFYRARLGMKTRGTDKVYFKAGAGVQQYNRPGDLGDKTTFNFDAAATWRTTDKIALQAGGRNGTQMSSLYADNGTEYSVVWASALYRMIPTVILSLNGAYRVDDYLDAVSGPNNTLVDRTDKGTAVRARADYLTPASFMRVYTEATYETVDSNVSSFDDTRVTVGVNLQY